MFDQRLHRTDPEMAFGDPAYRLDVAQTAGAFLDIGLEVLAAVVEFRMALALFVHLGGEKRAARPDSVRSGLDTEPVEQ